MVRFWTVLLCSLLLSGCGGGGDAERNTTVGDEPDSGLQLRTYEPYEYQQWYLEYNGTFYTQEGIDEEAGIGPDIDTRIPYTGRGVTVAVIDDGLDPTHEEWEDGIIATWNTLTADNNVTSEFEWNYHGTAVTGIIAARVNGKGIRGIAPEARIVFIKYHSNMSDSEIVEMLYMAEELGADVVNCSWGTYDVSPAVRESIEYLSREGRGGRGLIFVFAAGNDYRDMGNDESAIPEVIAVGSSDEMNLRAWYSNYGPQLDLLAPGGDALGITTTDPTGERGVATETENYLLFDDYYSFVGTSASAAIVSGAIALLLEKEPDLSREEVERRLRESCDKIGGISYDDEGFNPYYGYGKLNLLRLLGLLGSSGEPTETTQ